MAEYQVVIVSPQGETWDVTERVSTLTWSGSIKRVSRSVEAVMATPNDGSLPELPCELGNELLSRFNGLGELEVVEKPEAAALELAPGKNLQSLRVTEDISKLRNTVEIYSQTGARVRTVSDAESAALYGQFQHILTQRDGEDAGAEAQAYLEDNGLQQTMTVECLGDPELISGSAVLLRANTTGVTGLCWIDSDTHTWKNGQYFCRLSLNFRSLTNEVEAGQEV